MTNAPHLLFARKGVRYGQAPLYDHMASTGWKTPTAGKAMGVFAETCVGKYGFTREAQDQFAMPHRQAEANEDGSFGWGDRSVTLPGKAGGDRQVR
jgi:acetyl-CoA C-acetyltransferase